MMKDIIGWTLHCENPIKSWSWYFKDKLEFDENYEERSRWYEYRGTTYHYSDGTKERV